MVLAKNAIRKQVHEQVSKSFQQLPDLIKIQSKKTGLQPAEGSGA